jgi:hypothetical protein
MITFQNQNQILFMGTGGSAPRNAPRLKPTILKTHLKTYIPNGILKSTAIVSQYRIEPAF